MFPVTGHRFVLVLAGMQGTEVRGTGMSAFPQQGEEGYVSVTQPPGQPDEPGACWKMTLGGKSMVASCL